jgi:integrase/recombinase XerD
MDTGARAQEFISIDLEDVDLVTGVILIRHGKGGKPRTVFLGKKSRKALRTYLRSRQDNSSALWVSKSNERLTYWGLRQIMRRRAEKAGVQKPSLHSFRRFFAITMLRNGTDLVTLARLLGHSDLQVLERYLNQLPEDLQAAHYKASPVDNLKL